MTEVLHEKHAAECRRILEYEAGRNKLYSDEREAERELHLRRNSEIAKHQREWTTLARERERERATYAATLKTSSSQGDDLLGQRQGYDPLSVTVNMVGRGFKDKCVTEVATVLQG